MKQAIKIILKKTILIIKIKTKIKRKKSNFK